MVVLHKKERKSLELKHINIHSRVTLNELAQLMNVSEDTIRRDILELASENKITRIKGGAMALGNQYIPKKDSVGFEVEKKQIIAKKALGLLKEGMLVLIGGGTTIHELINIIPDNFKATFVTANPFTSIQLLEKPNLETIILGGRISNYSQTVIGGDAFLKLAEIKADLSIMGTNAIDVEAGVTDLEWDSVEIKKAIFRSSKKVAILAISEKLNTKMNLRVCGINEIDYLITELDPKEAELKAYQESGIQIL
jgi:DeoR family transcriptional regulator, fructose operon transcriptional repressor